MSHSHNLGRLDLPDTDADPQAGSKYRSCAAIGLMLSKDHQESLRAYSHVLKGSEERLALWPIGNVADIH